MVIESSKTSTKSAKSIAVVAYPTAESIIPRPADVALIELNLGITNARTKSAILATTWRSATTN
tara:strand:- start:134 stop:325 length:192 start_codon:yes stop_codon:yes gene_type:complete